MRPERSGQCQGDGVGGPWAGGPALQKTRAPCFRRSKSDAASRHDRRFPMEGCTVSKPKLYLARILVLIAVLAGWQYLPDISALRSRYHFLNPFFISSPEGVVKRMAGLASAPDWSSTVWPYLWQTVEGTLIGFAIGAAGGFIIGLTFSNAPRLNQVFGVFLMALNTLPRIALIPIIILLVGPGTASGVISAISVVFFLVFFNAFDGGTRVPGAVVSNARVMNASPLAIMA